jgi:hypothetical protein
MWMHSARCPLRAAPLLLLAVCAGAGIQRSAHADILQNQAVQGDQATLAAAGYGALNGIGICVGIVEGSSFANAYYGNGAANVTAPNSTLPNGNPDILGIQINFVQLPASGGNPAGQLPRGANAGSFPVASFRIGNHATEVTGVVIGQGAIGAADIGIAPGTYVQFAARNSGLRANSAAGQNNLVATIQTVAQQQRTPVVNMSFGLSVGYAITATDGSSTISKFVDWAAPRYNTLMVVAGNEGSAGAPSDSYNSINVGETGARGSYNNGVFVIGNGAVLNYGIASTYNTSNITTDISPITGYGRLKTDLVAPGGNPSSAGNTGTFNAPPAFNNNAFQTTAGGQYEFRRTNGNSNPVYSQDSFDGGVTTAQNGRAIDTAAPFVNGPPFGNNPNAGLGGNDTITASSLAGTSFAAPLVSGASTLLYQAFASVPINQSYADHRLIKALLLNGATHTYIDGNPLLRSDGVTPWSRLPGVGTTSLVSGVTAAQFGGSKPSVRPGLDPQLGTGLLNVVGSLNNYSAGHYIGGFSLVNPTGWDLNSVNVGAAANTIVNDYSFRVTTSGTFSATLCWDDPVTLGNAASGNTWQATSTLTRNMLTNLDLYLFSYDPFNDKLLNNIDYSTSDIDNVEYLYDSLPAGFYQLDVVNAQYAAPQSTTYGLAWSFVPVPEPASVLLLAAGTLPALLRRRPFRGGRVAAHCAA